MEETNIVNFTDISGGWMNIEIYDYKTNSIKKMRTSYIQNIFDDLLNACKFLLSDIFGIFKIEIDQEGFFANMEFKKFREDNKFTLQIEEDYFEDEIPYKETDKKIDDFFDKEVIPQILTYFY